MDNFKFSDTGCPASGMSKREKTLVIQEIIAYNQGMSEANDREMVSDEARHGKALKGLLERYFG